MKSNEYLGIVRDIECISCRLGDRFDEDAKAIIRIINDHGGDYTGTKCGNMQIPLLQALLRIVKFVHQSTFCDICIEEDCAVSMEGTCSLTRWYKENRRGDNGENRVVPGEGF